MAPFRIRTWLLGSAWKVKAAGRSGKDLFGYFPLITWAPAWPAVSNAHQKAFRLGFAVSWSVVFFWVPLIRSVGSVTELAAILMLVPLTSRLSSSVRFVAHGAG